MFSYKAQVDDAMDEDTVSLPHQQSFSSLKTDSDYIYQVHTPSIHMPLYDSQASKSFISKQRASLYSLTQTKEPNAHAYDSQITLYRSASGIRSFGRRLSAEKSTSEFVDYPLESGPLSRSQKSSPDLRFSSPSWKVSSVAHIKYGGPSSSVSNLLLSTDTASNFLYKPRANDSNVNLFPRTSKSSLESAVNKIAADHATAAAIENVSREYDSSSEVSAVPALKDTLQSILDSGTREIERDDSRKESLKMCETNISLRRGVARPKHLTTRLDIAESLKTRSDDDTLANVSHVSQQLLPRSTSFCSGDTYAGKSRGVTGKGESGGLNDYLLSVTSPKFRKYYRKYETRSDPDSPP